MMAGTPTTNYSLPTYADSDAPDLTGAYNAAVGLIDTQMKENADAAAAAATTANAASTKAAANETAISTLNTTVGGHTSTISTLSTDVTQLKTDVEALEAGSLVTSDSDAAFTTKMLAGAKVNKDGIVYFKATA